MADLSDFELINISGLPSGTAAGSNLLAQDDGSNTTKITINQAVAASQAMQQVNNKIGSTALPTTAQTLTGAIAEHEADLTALNGNISTLNGKMTIAEVDKNTLMSGVLSGLTFDSFYSAHRDGETMWCASITPTSSVSANTVLFTLQSRYKPWFGSNTYLILPIRSNASPYTEVATLWISSAGEAKLYGSLSAGTKYWICCPAYLSW